MFKLDEISHNFIEKLRHEDLGHIEIINYNELFKEFTDPSLKGKSPDFYHYKGSLTTPPCTDIVNWFLYPDVLPITLKHLEAF
jgi:carbonic anhydrase